MLLRILLVLLLPGLALAQDFRPAEPPPPDFSARQYIDSKGCVFLRDDDSGGWTARVSRDGAPICG
ncbi:MAG TPA: SPOR domain-containing protein, partial [Paracoccus sp. (in: a-proteobacteria)]|nr:SPOR domain-containing protein [Paracoccus sp. (in: a-proteobacteria)]